MGGECQRISMFLSVFDVHVQHAPVGGKIAYFKYTEGQFLNAMKTESAVHNENVLIGIEAGEPRGSQGGLSPDRGGAGPPHRPVGCAG